MASGPESSCWSFLFVYWHTKLLVSAQIVNRVRKNVSPDVYSSMYETICSHRAPLCAWLDGKAHKELGITKYHTDDRTEPSFSLGESGNSFLYLWRRTVSFYITSLWQQIPQIFFITHPVMGPWELPILTSPEKSPQNHPYLHSWHLNGLGCN